MDVSRKYIIEEVEFCMFYEEKFILHTKHRYIKNSLLCTISATDKLRYNCLGIINNHAQCIFNTKGIIRIILGLGPRSAIREIGLEISADKTKYMVMSRDQNAGRNHSVRNNNSTFERVEEFKYLGTTLTHQHSIAEEIKSRLRLGNASYHSVQNLLSSRLLSKNLKIKIYRTIILPVVL